ncbi:ATP-binding protein [Enterovibrio paralichthyis]|uniref:hybrid sensor histidine kinase/response regulator n=1 Tax=Enterovibrio paralichthyis TaxID=2853805 RepID=UPI001C448F56|nr:ATP-binding protein [Enterovibrio paralichthyis]MBV7299252.1 cyclic nucleotide-binding domain-containing protein [Enterovibrio paralichthyis]
MNQRVILCLDDDPSVLAQIERELSRFNELFDIICATSAGAANEILESLQAADRRVALFICDHTLGEDEGINLLINIDNHPASHGARTVLMNDQPDLEKIMQAVNEGRLNYCMTKPWADNELITIAKKELTQYVLTFCNDDLLKYCYMLDQKRLLDAHIENKLAKYRHGFIESSLGVSDEDLAKELIDGIDDFFGANNDHHVNRTYSENHILTHEGKPNTFLWFVVEGEVALIKRDETGAAHEVARLGQGSLIGGMSFVTGDVSFSTGITLKPTRVLKLNRSLFSEVMRARNDLLPLFSSYLLRHFNRRLKRSINTEVKLQQTLLSLEQAHKQLMEKEKMAMLGQLVAGVAHELNNPVSAILRNSDTLKDNIGTLINVELADDARDKANQIMANALLSRPVSTADARKMAKEIEPMIGNRNLARKAVNMGLIDGAEIQRWNKQLGSEFHNTLNQWDMFQQAGSLLRSTNVCAQRIADMVKSLKTYARQDDETMHEVDIHEGIEDTLIMFENQLKRIKLVKDYGDLRPIRCKPIALQQVWTNLISNALDAISQNGEIHVTTRETVFRSRKAVKVTVRDNGSGIPESIKNKIFELNYTTKREGHFGLGIGLSVCRQIVEHHGGTISVSSSPGEFTAMTVTLPYTQIITPLMEEQ